MPIIHRFTRLFTADVHAVLDRIEEPDVLLRQAIREMDHELGAMQARARGLALEQQRAADSAEREQELLGTLEDELDLCFAAGEEKLARGLVRRKLEALKRARVAAQRRATTDKARRELEDSIAEGRHKLAAMREKLEVLAEVPAHGDAAPCESVVSADEIEVAFLREKQQRARS